jgi:hypothetical protein
MPNPRELPPLAFPDGALGRLTLAAVAYAAAAAVIAASVPTILTPLPLQRLLPPAPHVVARTLPTEARP